MRFRHLMGIISFGIGAIILIALLQVPLSREDLIHVLAWTFYVSCCIPSIFVGLDLMFGELFASVEQAVESHEPLNEIELEYWIDDEETLGNQPC